MDDKNPNNLEGSNNRGSTTSSALAVVSKNDKSDDLVEENIDSQILSILGLEDIFDFTYEEYYSLLKEKAVQGRMSGSKMTTESVELITDELKRVRGKTGRFRVKKKKIDVNKVFGRKQPVKTGAIVKTTGLTPPVVAQDQGVSDSIVATQTAEITSGFDSILESLIVIRKILENQNKFQKKTTENERKFNEGEKKKEKEKKLETKTVDKAKEGSKLKAPVIGFFDAIKRFVKNILLGSVVLGLFKWLKDPSNKKAIDGFTKFLTDNAPLILGGLLAIAALPIATNLLGLTGAVLGGIPKLIGALKFLTSPAGIAALLFSAGKVIPEVFPESVDEQERKVQQEMKKTGSSTEQMISKLEAEKSKIGWFDPWGKKAEIDEQIYKLKTGETKSYTFGGDMGVSDKLIGKNYGYKGGERFAFKHNNEEYHGFLNQNDGKPSWDLYKGSGVFAQRVDTSGNKNYNVVKSFLSQISKKPKSKPQTPKIPGLPASAAQIGTGPAGNQVGSNMATFGETGNVSNAPGWVHGHFQTDTGTATDLVNDTAPIVKGLIDSGVTPELSKGQKFTPGMSMDEIKKLIRLGITQHGHSGDGRSVDIFVPKGTKVPFGLSDVRNTGGRGGITGMLPGSGKVWVGHLAPGSKSGGVHVPTGEMGQLAQTSPQVPSIPSPTGGNIAMLPLPLGLGQQQQVQSSSAPLQTPVPSFSSEDPNNMTTLVVKAIYNVVG